MVARASGIHHPLLVIPAEVGRIADLRERLGLPGAISAEAFGLAAVDRVGLLWPLRPAERLLRQRLIAGR
jgi:hypothetical protein